MKLTLRTDIAPIDPDISDMQRELSMTHAAAVDAQLGDLVLGAIARHVDPETAQAIYLSIREVLTSRAIIHHPPTITD